MSKYADIATEFTDGESLIKALEAMGFSPTNCIGKPQHLEGYQGDKRKELADIIIPRKQVGGAANDIGFVRGTDGKFKAIISSYDSTRYDQKWLTKLKVGYQEQWVQSVAKKQGYRAIQTGKKLANGKLEYVFLGR